MRIRSKWLRISPDAKRGVDALNSPRISYRKQATTRGPTRSSQLSSGGLLIIVLSQNFVVRLQMHVQSLYATFKLLLVGHIALDCGWRGRGVDT